MSTGIDRKGRQSYLVQVPAARGRVMPDMDSIKDDFPALCEPMTAITGRSISVPTLHGNENMSQRLYAWYDLPGCPHSVNDSQDLPPIGTLDGVG